MLTRSYCKRNHPPTRTEIKTSQSFEPGCHVTCQWHDLPTLCSALLLYPSVCILAVNQPWSFDMRRLSCTKSNSNLNTCTVSFPPEQPTLWLKYSYAQISSLTFLGCFWIQVLSSMILYRNSVWNLIMCYKKNFPLLKLLPDNLVRLLPGSLCMIKQ